MLTMSSMTLETLRRRREWTENETDETAHALTCFCQSPSHILSSTELQTVSFIRFGWHSTKPKTFLPHSLSSWQYKSTNFMLREINVWYIRRPCSCVCEDLSGSLRLFYVNDCTDRHQPERIIPVNGFLCQVFAIYYINDLPPCPASAHSLRPWHQLYLKPLWILLDLIDTLTTAFSFS